MGERNRVEWVPMRSGLGDEASCREYSVSAYNGGDWCVFTDGPHGDFGGTASNLAAAKLAAEAALRERGLIGEVEPTWEQQQWKRRGDMRSTMLCASSGQRWLVSVWDDGAWEIVDDASLRIVAKGNGGTVAVEEWLRANAALERGLIGHAVAGMTKDIKDAWLAGPDVMFAEERDAYMGKHASFGDVYIGGLRVPAPVRILSPAWVAASRIFSDLAAAMQTPDGRRELAAQAVNAAVAEGVRRGLDADALRVALVDDAEGPMRYGTAYTAHDAAHAVAAIERSPTSESAERYRRALAARNAKPLGRPPKRRWTTRREW